MRRLKKRAEFLAVARGARSARRAFVLQTLGRDEAVEPGCGFTVTKKVGNAVVRNRIRRRLREAIRLDADRIGRPGFDHVLIGRREALSLDFAALRADLAGAFAQGRKTVARAETPADSAAPSDRGGKAPRRGGDKPHSRSETPGRTR